MDASLEALEEAEQHAWLKHKAACELSEETKIQWTLAYRAVVHAKDKLKQQPTEPQKV